jgi:hypothetical protein
MLHNNKTYKLFVRSRVTVFFDENKKKMLDFISFLQNECNDIQTNRSEEKVINKNDIREIKVFIYEHWLAFGMVVDDLIFRQV